MNKVCPVCNKLEDINYICRQCKGTMVDKGRVQDYSDPYAGQYPINDSESYCVHLYQCLNCKETERKNVLKIEI